MYLSPSVSLPTFLAALVPVHPATQPNSGHTYPEYGQHEASPCHHPSPTCLHCNLQEPGKNISLEFVKFQCPSLLCCPPKKYFHERICTFSYQQQKSIYFSVLEIFKYKLHSTSLLNKWCLSDWIPSDSGPTCFTEIYCIFFINRLIPG